ncbi:universal stress protein [Anaerobacillus sp. MEB173]|uniref:universal stress protein n=1 Tax=Anaerobacillus sp. MEB173 TaxID=3383345 RepID=UPI003F936CA5
MIEDFQRKATNDALQAAISLAEKESLPFQTKIRYGVPSIEISSEANEGNYRCVILGSRGMGPVLSKFGSVSYGVLHLARCPVTIIPAN